MMGTKFATKTDLEAVWLYTENVTYVILNWLIKKKGSQISKTQSVYHGLVLQLEFIILAFGMLLEVCMTKSTFYSVCMCTALRPPVCLVLTIL